MSDGARRYVLDPWVRRSDRGRLLCGGAPGRLVRLGDAGVAALDALLTGERPTAGAEPLRERLLAAGMLHPLAAEEDGGGELTVVVPVRDGGESLPALVEALRGDATVVVVDDGSVDGSAERAAAAGGRVIANSHAPGPAGARNCGLAAADTELVAFVDADCTVAPGWAARLAGLLREEPSLALLAPRVRSAPGTGAIARYETAYSPLDLGAAPGLVGPGRRIGFLPAAALLCRRSALVAAGGFDERLVAGEDVDLVWRLLEAGWRIRYQPDVEVLHRPRRSVAGLARQRVAYGASAAELEARHPGAAAPLRAGPHSLLAWAGATAGPRGLLTGLAASAAWAASRGGGPAARRALAGLALRGNLHAGGQLARALSRDWLPLTALACLASRRARRLAALAFAVDVLAAARPGGSPPVPPVRLALRALDNAAYAAGLWRGAWRARSAAALLPRGSRTPERP